MRNRFAYLAVRFQDYGTERAIAPCDTYVLSTGVKIDNFYPTAIFPELFRTSALNISDRDVV